MMTIVFVVDGFVSHLFVSPTTRTAISKMCGSFNVGIVFMLIIVDVFVIQLSVPLQVAQTFAS